MLAWRLSNSLETHFCLEALEEALEQRAPTIFNTDQGAQFTSGDFTSRLEQKGVQISMDGRGRALDNIFVERLWRTVKWEEVYAHDYQALQEAWRGLHHYFGFYNQERRHEAAFKETVQDLLQNYDTICDEVLKDYRILAEDAWARLTASGSRASCPAQSGAETPLADLAERLHAGEGQEAFVQHYLEVIRLALPTRIERARAMSEELEGLPDLDSHIRQPRRGFAVRPLRRKRGTSRQPRPEQPLPALRPPQVLQGAWRAEYAAVAWQHNERFFEAWRAGQTGYPLVDAGMRQLQREGWMHNRARMVVAMFLTRDLLLDWREGERYFMQQLIDGDLAANNGGWQWSASTGAGAPPSFRIFNPIHQSRRFDPEGVYIRRYVPELRQVPLPFLHTPWRMSPEEQRQANCQVGKEYPPPIVEHDVQRERAMALYRERAAQKRDAADARSRVPSEEGFAESAGSGSCS